MNRTFILSLGIGSVAAVLALVGLGVAQDKPDPNKPADNNKTTEQLNKELETFGQDLSKQLRDLREQLKTIRPGMGQGLVSPHGVDPRLGVVVSKPGPALLDQLELKPGQGLVVTQVIGKTPADVAGLMANDVLLQFAGQDVPSDAAAFLKMVHEVKTGMPVDAVVIRKGKKETIKDIKLADPKPRSTGVTGLPYIPGASVADNKNR